MESEETGCKIAAAEEIADGGEDIGTVSVQKNIFR